VADDQDPADAGTDAKTGTRAIKDRNQRIREEAAQKRKGRREGESRRAAVQRNLDAGELVDDAFARGTHAATSFVKRHLNLIQWVIVLGVAGGIGWQIYAARKHKTEAKATETLVTGISAEFGRVGEDAETQPDPMTGLGDPRPHFADEGARLKAAQDAYRAAAGSETIRTLGQLALAGTLFDAGKYKEALTAYEGVRSSTLAKTDTDAKYRAIEGIGLSQEALGAKDAARKAFHDLSASDDAIFAALGMYHEGRLAFAAGERDPAKALLKKAMDKVTKADSADSPPSYVGQRARDLLGQIDPSAVPPPPSKGMTPEQLQALMKQAGDKGGDGKPSLSKEQLEELIKNIQKNKPPAVPSGAPVGAP
jgi:predicted negative regulator of RcsB-dependent stress response